MGSSGKKKTTMAKLNRERKLRERRIDKQAKKDARKEAAANPSMEVAGILAGDAPADDDDQPNPETE
jgi:hypothetical protein